MARVKFIDYFNGLETMQKWIVNDLRRATINGKANFLVAMGIFNYIEILGSFYTGRGRPCGKNFEVVFTQDLLPPSYKSVYDKIERLTIYKGENNRREGGAYDCLRCGMTHQYLIKNYDRVKRGQKIRFTIYGVDDSAQFAMDIIGRDCGIEISEPQKNFYHLKIFNSRFIFDLNLAFDNLKKKILTDKTIKSNFLNRAREVNLHLLQ